jgi:hypothetical protein
MNKLQIAKGTDATFIVTLMAEGLVVEDYGVATNDTLAAVIWAGDDGSILASPTVDWTTDGSDGKLTLMLAGSDTSSLDPGTYRLRITINTEDGRSIVAYDGHLDVESSPGTADPLTTYGTYEDMLRYAPWLQQMQHPEEQAGFMEARHEARGWLERIILARYHPETYPGRHVNWTVDLYRDGPSATLRGYLEDDQLVVTEHVREIVAKRAIGTVLFSAVGPDSKDLSTYQQLGARFLAEADSLVSSLIAEVEDDLGNVILRVNCSRVSYRA